MRKRLFAILLIFTLMLNLAACGRDDGENGTSGKKRYEAEFLLLFDTVTQIIGYTDTKEEFSEYAQFFHDSLQEYHQLYDIYNDYEGINNIKTINDNAGIAPVKVDRRIIDLLLFSKEANELTGGKTNVALGSVLKIWHDYRTEGLEDPENAKLPPMAMLEEAAKHTDINKVIIDEENLTVFLEDPAMSLDVGAVAKGYATERVTQMAVEHGFTSALFSVGGNVRAVGTKGDGKTLWSIGVRNPKDQTQNIDLIYVTDESLVTSGNYERFYTVNGKDYNHIINPDTLFPADYYAAVTIVCKDSGLADALSTAVFTMPFEEGLTLIESLPGTEALWVFNDGTTKSTSHFEDLVVK